MNMTMHLPAATIATAAGLMLVCMAAIGAPDCGTPGTIKIKTADGKSLVDAPTRIFKDGSVAVRARLAVNPDGGPSSYSAGDHGFTYLANGMNRWTGTTSHSCQGDPTCGSDFVNKAEKQGFAPGTPAFCVYAFEVVPYAKGGKLTSCGSGRSVVGNGLGKPRPGALVENASGEKLQTYLSTTSIKHMVEGEPRYLDAERLPIAVTPVKDLLGKVVWVGGKGYQPTLAFVGDLGPAFGEGSIAMHQLLHTGTVTAQRPGPITTSKRCGPEELALKKPFQSRPDAGPKDACKPGYKPTTTSDIRAYSGISDLLDFVLLGQAALPRQGAIVQTEVTRQALSDSASSYSADEIQRMLACLSK